jgi:hypothetical protein
MDVLVCGEIHRLVCSKDKTLITVGAGPANYLSYVLLVVDLNSEHINATQYS